MASLYLYGGHEPVGKEIGMPHSAWFPVANGTPFYAAGLIVNPEAGPNRPGVFRPRGEMRFDFMHRFLQTDPAIYRYSVLYDLQDIGCLSWFPRNAGCISPNDGIECGSWQKPQFVGRFTAQVFGNLAKLLRIHSASYRSLFQRSSLQIMNPVTRCFLFRSLSLSIVLGRHRPRWLRL
jgi:hypothetical protein